MAPKTRLPSISKQFKAVRAFFIATAFAAAPIHAFALPYNNGIVVVGDREFFVGELTDSLGASTQTFNFRHAPWLEDILNNDPVLFNQGVRFLRTGVPALDLVGDVSSELREQDRLEDDPLYMAPGHDVVVRGLRDMYIYPTNSSVNYSVFCTRSREPGELNLCSILVAYPYGTDVALTARRYFPGQLPDVSRDFEAIALRMIEIAVCMDVTDQSNADRPTSDVEVLENSPNMAECRILLSS